MYVRTPSKITRGILKFCNTISKDTIPQYVQIVPIDGAIPNECFGNVDKKILKFGGSKILGWTIWEWKYIFFEAELHAVWKSPKGALLDVSLASDSKEKRRLFLPDCNAQFNSQRINNIRKALRHDQVIQDFFNAFDEKNALLEKYSNPSQFGYVNIPVQEARAVQFKIAESQKKLIQLPSLNVNDLCYCGSGLKYKHCCL